MGLTRHEKTQYSLYSLAYEEIRELINNTSFNERSDEVFLADIARRAGLVTGQVGRFQLFYLPDDYREEKNLAADHPEKLRELGAKLLRACNGNMYHGTWENHKAVRIDELLAGSGPEDAFPLFERWRG